MKKTELKMNKTVYLGQAILDISKTLMYEFWYDYIKPVDKARLCYMDTDNFIMYIKTEDFYKDIGNDVDKWFDTSNYDKNDNRPLEIGKNKKVIGKFKDELGGKIMIEFSALRAKAYAFKLNDDNEVKNAKGTKKCIVKREITFKNYADALFNDEVLIKSQQRFRSDNHKVCTEEINKIAPSSNDDRRIQTFDKVTTFPYGTNVFKVCENQMRYVLQRKNMLNNESQALRSESQKLRTESKELRNEAQALRSDHHKVYTEELNKIELHSNNDKRIETFDKVTTYPYGTNVFKVCEGEMLSTNKLIEPDEVIDNTKTEDIDKTKTKDKGRNKRRNKRIQMFLCIKRRRNKNGNRKKKRRIVWAFWDDDHISELCEK